MGARGFTVNIVGLKNTVHHFNFDVANDFFSHYGTGLLTEGTLKADVTLDKRETFIEATFAVRGTVALACDRSLDPFDYPIKADKKLVFKYGDTDEELSDEIVVIRRDSESLELGQYIFEFIALEVPIKKLHPRFRDEDDEEDREGKIVYTSRSSDAVNPDEGEAIDPRWEKLKKLK